MKETSVLETIAQECIAARLRLLNQIISRVYDEALAPYELSVSQVSLLIAVSRGVSTPGRICRFFWLDKATLRQDLEHLRARGWLVLGQGECGSRTRQLRTTPEGLEVLHRAAAAWREAQNKAEEILGAEGVAALGRMTEKYWEKRIAV
jgi:DNA-binding MarR family transcriptional regulator